MLDVGDCSGEACLNPPGSLPYGASRAGSAFMLAAFGALIPPVIYAALRYRTVPLSLLLLAALLVEVVGHVGKVLLAANPASDAYLTVYLMGTHWGAILIGSATNLVLPHVMVIYGPEFQLVSEPLYLNILFFILDISALSFQSVGIGFASTANTAAEVSQGLIILLTGLAVQAVNLLTFLSVYRYFRHRLEHRRYILDDRYSLVYLSRRFKYFMICVQAISCLLLFRTAVRIAVFADGLASSFARSQITSFLLDDALVLVAAMIHAAYPAGRAFGAAWAATSPLASSSSSRRQDVLPLRLRRHRRRRGARTDKRIVSLPYPSPSATSRFSPGVTHIGGMTPGLPAHPSPRVAPEPSPPLTSPQQNPVHRRAPYEISPTSDVPFFVSQESPGLDSTMWTASSPPLEYGTRRKTYGRRRAGSSPELTQMVDRDALW
ncbi:hypothetical protein MYCTH_2307348 [Thermothelomyces thermophilus ATCC 42464]|uniref:RTA1 like protein n=1 Tax=Thermothelomyces thermophilus (strain ATCC 42464 / BCRC 31852 / DSM 1799) TaxID=573729 RepID=G2QFL5_THET4|nr:uncharacterized protein MYCTH_2307348 [Thermothelomyces thermophilus ATCC 42464]AEO59232.1 hypothetical protein MYCTH_2307348 [Thermothelomyces thermophilus ATCC 42464]